MTKPLACSNGREITSRHSRMKASVVIEPTSSFDQNTRRSPPAPIMGQMEDIFDTAAEQTDIDLFAAPLRLAFAEKSIKSFTEVPTHIAHQNQILAFFT